MQGVDIVKKYIMTITTLCLIILSVGNYRSSILALDQNEKQLNDSLQQSEEYLKQQEESDLTIDGDGNLISSDTTYDKNGNIVKSSRKARSVPAPLASDLGTKYGFVDFKSARGSADYIKYTNLETGADGYIGGNTALDAAYLGLDANGKVKFKMAGVTGVVHNNSQVKVIADSNSINVSYYKVSNGWIQHWYLKDFYSNSWGGGVVVGPKQPYMKENVAYFSYDGHYFYTDTTKMLDDYLAGTSSRAINPTTPYYSYYQYLSHRSTSSFTAGVFDAYTESKRGGRTSKMSGIGSSFLSNETPYGANAGMMYAVASNESAYGTSSIAINKNNLFGHAAYDSDPSGSANGYSSPAYSIFYHASQFISRGYLDPHDWRYEGSHLGDKAGGINVRYASDPYWGEVAAGILYNIDMSNGNKDYGRYTIGIKKNNTDVNIRKEPNTTSTILYSTGKTTNYPFIILDKVTGETVSGSNVWYKIQTDPSLNSSRSAIVVADNGAYDYKNSYAYIHSSFVEYVSDGSGVIPTPPVDPEPPVTPEPPAGVRGDVNGNGYVDAADYLIVMDTIVGKYKMNESQKKLGDVNKNGQIDAADYLMIMDCILGKIEL